MKLGDYRLLAQLGAGRDGIAYRALPPGGETPVEIRVLSAARADRERWDQLTRRLRLAALLEHPAAVRIRESQLEEDPPFVVLAWAGDKSLDAELHARVPLPAHEVAGLAHELAATLAEAHRLGLAHGCLGPGSVRLDATGKPKLDFTGLDVQSAAVSVPSAELAATCHAPQASAEDVYHLGVMLCWLLTGRVQFSGELSEPWRPLIREMLAPDPGNRPSALEVVQRLTAIREEVEAARLAVTSALQVAGGDAGVSVSQTAAAPPAMKDESVRERTGRARLLQELGQVGPDGEAMPPGERLGRFRLLEKLGEGGMGAVYRAEDLTDGAVVAIKVLRADWAARPESRRRFYKEARLLAEANNPHVTNLLEVNEDGGLLYLVLEFVAGRNLGQVLAERSPLEEPVALAILADVARALLSAHQRGIIHRDVKPENILLVSGGVVSGEWSGVSSQKREDVTHHSPLTTHHSPKVKLSDFGLARHVVESESLQMTQAGAILGTPLYMAPEQCMGAAVDQRTDVYAMGATLFHLLAGRPPFLAPTSLNLATMHCHEPPPPLQKFNPGVSDGACRLVERCLAKSPEARYPDAQALLHDLERLLRGEPASIAIHPRLPECDPRYVVSYDFVWELESSPADLWPHVSNTERLNRAVGLPAVQFSARAEPETLGGTTGRPRTRRFGRFRKLGFLAAWEEHPFEWIEGRRMGVLREYSKGPFRWLVSVVELAPRPGGGTVLSHRVRLQPRGLFGRAVAAVEVGFKGRRALDRVYRRIDAALTGKLGSRALADPFEQPAALSGARRRRLDALLDRLSERGLDPAVVERLGDFLATAADQEVARIRPLALARRLSLDPQQVVAACLHGAREGLLVLLWDILCPLCRIPCEIKDTLQALRDHGHCEACNLDFDLDFANAVEMIFRVHPAVRASELRTYCIGGPVHSPHVAAQVRVAPHECMELALELAEGEYRLRGPQLPFAFDFRVRSWAVTARWELNLASRPDPELPRSLKTGGQLLVLRNDTPQELLVRVERTASRSDALTAARASSLALFRELFPGELLSPGQLASVANVTLLVTGLDGADDLYRQLGDARAFGLIHHHLQLLEEHIRREGGALVKTTGAGVLATFHEATAAVRAGLSILAGCGMRVGDAAQDRELLPKVGVHRGPAMVATLNDHLDYFGTTVQEASALVPLACGGDLVLTQIVAADLQVASLLRTRGLEAEILQTDQVVQPGGILHRIRMRAKPGS